MSVRSAVGLESKLFCFAEAASMVVSLGVVAVLDSLIPKEIMHHATDVVAKTCIEPFQDTIEKGMRKFVKLDEFKVDESKTKQERAQIYAHTLMVFGGAWLLSWGAKLATRDFLNRRNGIVPPKNNNLPAGHTYLEAVAHKVNPKNWNKEDLLIMAADEGIHYGAIGCMALNQTLASFTDDNIKSMTNLFEKIGVPPKKAKELANYAVIYEASNLLGMASGIVVIAGKHAYLPSTGKFHGWKDIWSGVAKSEHVIGSH